MDEFSPFTESKNSLFYLQEHVFNMPFITCNMINFLCKNVVSPKPIPRMKPPLDNGPRRLV